MKRFTLFFAACAALFCISCKKTDPDRIQFTVEGDGSFSRIELAESVNARLVISAPRKINGLTVSMALGGFNSIANQHIGIEPNKGTEKRNSVFDLINDGKANIIDKGALNVVCGFSVNNNHFHGTWFLSQFLYIIYHKKSIL